MHPDEYCVKNCEDYGLEAYEGFCAEYETTPAAECSPNMPFFHPNGVDCVMSCQDIGMEENDTYCHCSDGMYMTENYDCSPCTAGCEECGNDFDCYIYKCEEGLFWNTELSPSICSPCIEGCMKCTGPYATDCLFDDTMPPNPPMPEGDCSAKEPLYLPDMSCTTRKDCEMLGMMIVPAPFMNNVTFCGCNRHQHWR